MNFIINFTSEFYNLDICKHHTLVLVESKQFYTLYSLLNYFEILSNKYMVVEWWRFFLYLNKTESFRSSVCFVCYLSKKVKF